MGLKWPIFIHLMRTLDKIIERYRIDDDNDGIGSISWGMKMYYRKNSTIPIHLNRRTGSFILTDDDKAFELDVDHMTFEGQTLDEYYPHPYLENRKIKGFRIIKPIPNFDQDSTYLIQSGMQGDDYISGSKYNSIYFIADCWDYPEFFEPLYE